MVEKKHLHPVNIALLIGIPVFILVLVPVLLIVLGPSLRSGPEINPASHLNSLDAEVLDFDIIIDGKWRFPASRRSGEVRIVPPFDVSFEPTGVLLEHADDWSIELGGHELGWGDSFSVQEDDFGSTAISLVEQSTGSKRADYPYLRAVESGVLSTNSDGPRRVPKIIRDSLDGLTSERVQGEIASGFTVALVDWTAYENESGERSGFDATFMVSHPSMGPDCEVGVIGPTRSTWSSMRTEVLGPRELGEYSPPLYDLPAFDGPGYVSMVSEHQWWADWTRGEHESTLDVSVRLLPSTSGMESVRQDHFERLRSSLPAHASGDVLDGETNRERPVTRLHMHFQINCDDGCYRVHDSSFDVPISGIQKLEQPEPGVNFHQPE